MRGTANTLTVDTVKVLAPQKSPAFGTSGVGISVFEAENLKYCSLFEAVYRLSKSYLVQLLRDPLTVDETERDEQIFDTLKGEGRFI